jgi:hypothetical protein
MKVMTPNPELEARLRRAEHLITEAIERDRARDERIDALTQNVELLATLHRDNEIPDGLEGS